MILEPTEHEEGVGDIEAPDWVLTAELCTLLEDPLHAAVLLPVPVQACNRHQNCKGKKIVRTLLYLDRFGSWPRGQLSAGKFWT